MLRDMSLVEPVLVPESSDELLLAVSRGHKVQLFVFSAVIIRDMFLPRMTITRLSITAWKSRASDSQTAGWHSVPLQADGSPRKAAPAEALRRLAESCRCTCDDKLK